MSKELAAADWKAAGLLAAGLGVLFWTQRAPSFGPGDSAQHVLSALTLGVSRPPGYPLLNFLGHCASRLPFGDPASNVNGLSGLLHAGAAAFLLLTLRRLGASLAAALCAAGLMAFSPLFWFYSEVAEARALNDFLALGAAYAAVWRSQGGGRRALLWLCAGAGLGLGHHPTFVLILPALVFWLWRAGALKAREWILLTAGTLAFLLAPYGLLWLRLKLLPPPAYNPDAVGSLADIMGLLLRRDTGGFWRMLPGQGGLLGASGLKWASLARHAGWFAASFAQDLALVSAALAAGAIVEVRRRKPDAFAFWGLWLALSCGPFILASSQQLPAADPAYLQGVCARFYLLPSIAVHALAGLTLGELFARARPALVWAAAAVCLLVPPLMRPLGQRGREPLMEYARDIVKASGPRDIVILASDDTIFAALYLDLVARATGERIFLEPLLLSYPPYLRGLRERHPDLAVPTRADGSVKGDLKSWVEANPDRGLLAEGLVAAAVAAETGLTPCPEGSLVRLTASPAPRAESARRCERFLDEDFLGRVARWDLQAPTQEVYLLRAAEAQLAWCAAALTPQDTALARRLLVRLNAL